MTRVYFPGDRAALITAIAHSLAAQHTARTAADPDIQAAAAELADKQITYPAEPEPTLDDISLDIRAPDNRRQQRQSWWIKR